MTMFDHLHRHAVVLYLLGCVLLLLSSFLVVEHVLAIRGMADTGVPLAQRIVPLAQRLHILEQQIQAAQLQAAVIGGTDEEIIRQYVLPDSPDLDRLLAFFEVLRDAFTEDHLLSSMSAIELESPHAFPALSGVFVQPLHMTFDGTPEGIRAIFSLLSLAGSLSVGDAIPLSDLQDLLHRTEEENPTGIVAVEHFLSTDLLRYAREPKPFEEQLRRSFTSDAFLAAFQKILDTSLLDVRRLFGGRLGSALEAEDLWPLRFLILDRAEIVEKDDDLRLSIMVQTFYRVSRGS